MPSTKFSSVFEKAYENLNPAQRQAVNTIDGPVIVLAGPGTGKTQILTLRIANILKQTDVNPRNILALTFTEAATTNMRNRLLSIIGEAAYAVRISTFHAFCASVISDNPEEFPLPHESAPLTELERFEIISTIIRNNELSILKPINDPMYYAKSIVSHISTLKREGITPEAYETIVDEEGTQLAAQKDDLKVTIYRKKERNYNKHKDLLILYRQYQESLLKTSRYDFDDMIALTDQVFSHNDVLLQEYQERFQYILVDEYQDTNGAQNHVVNLLASFWGEEANIFVVGDINQSIYRFQGASAENVLSFLNTYPNATVITLTHNYRSTQQILDASRELITHNSLLPNPRIGSPVSLQATIPDGDKLCLVHLPSTQLETVYIAQQIRDLIKNGTSPDDIVVIYRNNNDAIGIADTLARWEIPYEIEGGANILKTPIITQLLVLFAVIDGIRNAKEDIDLFTLLNYEWVGLDSLAILKYVRAASKRGIALLEAIMEQPAKKQESRMKNQELREQNTLFDTSLETTTPLITHHQSLTPPFIFADDPAQKQVQEFVLYLIDFMHKERQMTFIHWFEWVLNESGFLPYVLHRPTVVEDLNRINTLFNEVKRFCNDDHACSLARFLEIIETMNRHGLPMLEEDQNVIQGSVRLTTAHKSKGQEWQHVFIMTAIDGKWGNNAGKTAIPIPEGILKNSTPTDQEQQELEDERRLFYVAITRAKHMVTITIPDIVVSGSRSKETVPSLFVTELGPQTQEDKPPEYNGDQQKELLTKLLTPQPAPNHSDEEKAWLAELLQTFKLSPTALNTYLDCHYKFKLNHLLKVPRAKQDYLNLGTAVHKALELFFKRMQQNHGQVPTVEYLLTSFEVALKKEVMTLENYQKRLTQGKHILSMYYATYQDEFTNPLFCERQFGYGSSWTVLNGIPLQGKVDRIDWVDQARGTVKLVDYKTGKPKSLNEIEGKTATSDGAYKRQLVFYKLLTQLDKTFTPKAELFEFDFIEADKQTGRHKKIAVSITDEELESLKTLIQETMQQIRALAFERTTNTHICQICEFNKHCWPEGIPAAH